MQSGDNHHPGCENAEQHKCVCRQCDGNRHGWQSRLGFVRDPTGEARAIFRDKANRHWEDSHKGRTRRKPSKRKKAAATDIAESNVVDWMAHELNHVAQERSTDGSTGDTTDEVVETVGNLVANKVASKLEDRLGSVSRERRIQLTSHLWCDLLAAIACGIKKFQEELDKVPKYAATLIIKSRTDEQRETDKALIRLATRVAWKSLMDLSPIPSTQNLLRATRILAIFICPAPEDHKQVAKCCLDPLAASEGGSIIKEETKKKLLEVLPSEWLPNSSEST